MYPATDTQVFGVILLVNEKPQGVMYFPPCIADTNSYGIPPVYIKLEFFLDAIFAAADGNVDNQ